MAMDLPYGAHWRKLLLWAVVQGLIVATGIVFSNEISHAAGGMETGMCPGEATNCHIPCEYMAPAAWGRLSVCW